ncbi:MAG: hypothetical protein JWO00_134 [Candidatus Parcubacteria bacterium]|nr:hypothetical protein [Candidatus Parcubacteria bacterium]
MKPTLTIGIAAYNEEQNIGRLLESLFDQKITHAGLREIVVVSDSSTDKTDEIVKSMAPRGVRLIRPETRVGGAGAQNLIFRQAQTDLLVILDADILPFDSTFIDRLIVPIIQDQAIGLTSGFIRPLPPQTFVEKVLARNHVFKNDLWMSFEMKDTVYTCFGPARAFSKALYSEMEYPKNVPVDAYSYMYCIERGMRFFLARDATALFRCPENFNDHKKQSMRFESGKDAIVAIFGKKAEDAYHLPFKKLFLMSLKELLLHPVLFIAFILISIRVRMAKRKAFSGTWEIAHSSKHLIAQAAAVATPGLTKPKVIFSNYDDINNPYYGGGGAIAIHEVAKRLASSFDITVLTSNYPGAKPEVRDGIEYERIGPAYGGPFVGQILFHIFAAIHAMRDTYDLWIESFTPPISTSFLPVFTPKPVIGLVHMLSASNMTRKYHLPFEIVENFGLQSYSKIIVLTDEDARKIKSKNPRIETAVIGNGVPLPLQPNDPKSVQGKALSFIGRIEIDQKGIDLLLEAYAIVRKQFDIPLVIAGSGAPAHLAKMSKLIKHYKLEDDVKLLGWVDQDAKEAFFRNTLIGVTPSRYETFSLATLEMMSYAIPIVAFDIPGLSWTGHDTMIKVPSFDAAALADAILSLLRNEDERAKLALNSRAFTKENSWDASAEKYRAFIAQSMKSLS